METTLNANTASFEELHSLPGLSKKNAKLLMNARPFDSLEAIGAFLQELGIKKWQDVLSNLYLEEDDEDFEDMFDDDPQDDIVLDPLPTFQVEEWAGTASDFDPLRFRRWLQRHLMLSEGRSRSVTKHIQSDFAYRDKVRPQELITTASRLAINLPYSMRDANKLAFYSPAMLSPIMASGSVLAGIPGLDKAGDIFAKIVDFVKAYYGGDWRVDNGGNKLTLETGGGLLFGDDGTAPHFDMRFYKITCCKPKLGGKGVRISFKLNMTDDSGNLGNDSGVAEAEVAVFEETPGGKLTKHTVGKKKFNEKTSDKTEDATVKKKYSVCIPCRLIKDGKVNLMTIVKDHDDNRQIQFYMVPIPEEKIKKCCK